MIKKIHAAFGLALAGLYIYAVTHLESVLPGLAVSMKSGLLKGPLLPTPGSGSVYALQLPLVPIVCFLAPGFLTRRLSPRTKALGEPVLTEGFWLVMGYFFLAVSVAVLALFRGPF